MFPTKGLENYFPFQARDMVTMQSLVCFNVTSFFLDKNLDQKLGLLCVKHNLDRVMEFFCLKLRMQIAQK